MTQIHFDFEKWEEYVHDDWEMFTTIKQTEEGKHFFVCDDITETQKKIAEIEDKLAIAIPDELQDFFNKIGSGYLWANKKDKIGIYNMLSPDEIHDLYFPNNDEDEDWFESYRKRAWNNLKTQLLAFCVFGEEDSLLYLNLNDGGVYYLSNVRKIANSLQEFFESIDKQVDYFVKK